MAKTRIDWTDEERKKWFDAAIEMMKQQKFKPPTDWKGVSKFMNIVRQALVVLPENRRRPLYNTDTIRVDLPKFIEAGFIPANVLDLRKAGGKRGPDKDDPTTIRLNQLADERDAAVKLAEEQSAHTQVLKAENHRLLNELSKVPSEAQVIKTFIADILADVQARGRALPGPTGDEVNRIAREAAARETLHAKKHNPEPSSEERPKKPLVLIVNNENQPVNVDKWQAQFPDITLREVDVRGDGRVTIPKGAEDVVMIQGVRHATTAAVKQVYPNARLVMNLEVANLLSSINERLKGEKHA